MMNVPGKFERAVAGKVIAFMKDGEDINAALSRVAGDLLKGEMVVNGDTSTRLHLNLVSHREEPLDKTLAMVLNQILESLPTNKDWLDPQLEQVARELVAEVQQ